MKVNFVSHRNSNQFDYTQLHYTKNGKAKVTTMYRGKLLAWDYRKGRYVEYSKVIAERSEEFLAREIERDNAEHQRMIEACAEWKKGQ